MAPQTRSQRKRPSQDTNDDDDNSATDSKIKPSKSKPSPPDSEDESSLSPSSLPTPSLTSRPLRMSYVIGPGETGVLTFEPYKSILLPLWRFRTEAIARRSSAQLHAAFAHYCAVGDFVGADMARKFLQMGMTRAGRYANYAGGRKYDAASGAQRAKSAGHAGKDEKARAKEVFRAVWERARADPRYADLREGWRGEKKGWERERKKAGEAGGGE